MLKKRGYLGSLVGIAGSIYLIAIGLQAVFSSGSQESDLHNGKLFAIYGVFFFAIFLSSVWLIRKHFWKINFFIGLLCTLFSVLGLFSIGPFLFLGSIIILIQSFIHILKGKEAPVS